MDMAARAVPPHHWVRWVCPSLLRTGIPSVTQVSVTKRSDSLLATGTRLHVLFNMVIVSTEDYGCQICDHFNAVYDRGNETDFVLICYKHVHRNPVLL